MELLYKLLFAYLLLINAVGLGIMCADKQFAKKNHRRVPEARLMTIAAIGGSVGSILGMYWFRHKTRHPKFYIGLPLILLAQLSLALIAVWYFCLRP